MRVALSRAVMALAASCLGGRRRDWARAMQMEFEAASEDGKSLSFALGCLMAAWRDLPSREEGRLVIASHIVVFALIIPTAALLASTLLADFPYSYLGPIEPHGLLEIGRTPLFSEGNRSAVPSLAALVILLAASHLRIAWLVLERDWVRVAAMAALIAASTVTLVIFATVVFVYDASALAEGTALAIELSAISALARWHARSFHGASEVFV